MIHGSYLEIFKIITTWFLLIFTKKSKQCQAKMISVYNFGFEVLEIAKKMDYEHEKLKS